MENRINEDELNEILDRREQKEDERDEKEWNITMAVIFVVAIIVLSIQKLFF